MHHLICTSSDQYLPQTECRILSISHSVVVPQLSEHIFGIDFLDNCDAVHVKWLGCLPNKCKIFKKVPQKKETYHFLISTKFRRSRPLDENIESSERTAFDRFRFSQTNSRFGRRLAKVKISLIYFSTQSEEKRNKKFRVYTTFNLQFLFSKVLCLRTISSNQDALKVKKVLGVQPHDHQLITYWNSSLPNLL